jgi:hypothetical protein
MESAINEYNYSRHSAECAGVYLIGSTAHGWYKIGQSSSLNTRVAHYRSLPFIVDICRTWKTGEETREIEKQLHRVFKSVQIRANGAYSEWFALSPEDIELLEALMRMYPEADSRPIKTAIDYAQVHSIVI